MPSIFLNALIRTPFLGGFKLALAERSVFKNFSFYTTSDPEELDEIYRIRYKVYCEEYKYLEAKNYPNKREKDEYDANSLHLVVRHRTGDLAATVRLILGADKGLPILQHFEIDYQIPKENYPSMAEVSRLIVGRSYRRKHLLMVLVKALYLLAKEKKINDVFCVIDDRLYPSLKELGIPVKKIGQPKLFQGVTAPYLIQVSELEELMLERNKSLLKFLSNGVLQSEGKDYKYAPH